MKKKAQYRIEIIEQKDGWWVGQIWNAEMVYQAHARSEEVARRQVVEEFAKHFDRSITPEPTIKYLRK